MSVSSDLSPTCRKTANLSSLYVVFDLVAHNFDISPDKWVERSPDYCLLIAADSADRRRRIIRLPSLGARLKRRLEKVIEAVFLQDFFLCMEGNAVTIVCWDCSLKRPTGKRIGFPARFGKSAFLTSNISKFLKLSGRFSALWFRCKVSVKDGQRRNLWRSYVPSRILKRERANLAQVRISINDAIV